MDNKVAVKLSVNSDVYKVLVDSEATLLKVLREQLGLTGTKCGCNHGVCGACTVLMDDKPVRACLSLALAMQGRDIVTIEGLANGDELHPLQQSFVEHQASQCGFCTSGMIISAKALLDRNPNPSVDEIRIALGGNICRCTGYVKIIDSIRSISNTQD